MSASSFAATCATIIAQVDIRIVVNRYVNTYMLDHTISMTLLLLNIVRKKKSVVEARMIGPSLLHKVLHCCKSEKGSLAGAIPA